MIQKFYMDGSRKIPHRKVARTILPKVMGITEGNILPRVISVLLTVILLTVISQIDSTSINVATTLNPPNRNSGDF